MKRVPAIITILNGVRLLLCRKVHIQKSKELKEGLKSDNFHVFRYAEKKTDIKPEARFEITFQLKNMSGSKNEKFSYLPMFFVLGFQGFCSKYWLIDYETNTCRGIYEWQHKKDAVAYSNSVAVRFMKLRSVEGSVRYQIYDI